MASTLCCALCHGPAALRCINDAAFLCDGCHISKHLANPLAATHQVVSAVSFFCLSLWAEKRGD
jgi:hypothetical protein